MLVGSQPLFSLSFLQQDFTESSQAKFLLPEVVPVSTASCTVISLPDKSHAVTPVVVAPVGDLTNVHVRSLDRSNNQKNECKQEGTETFPIFMFVF